MPYELWARKRPIDGKGHKYEFVTSFMEEYLAQTKMDTLDRNVWQEAMVVKRAKKEIDNDIIMFREFDRPYQYTKKRTR